MISSSIISGFSHSCDDFLDVAHVYLSHSILISFVNIVNLLLELFDLFLNLVASLGEIKLLEPLSENDDLILGRRLGDLGLGCDLHFLCVEVLGKLG